MRRPLRRWRPLGPRRLVCLRSASVSRTRSRTSLPAGWSHRSSSRSSRTGLRIPCRTSRRRGSRCRSSRRSRRSRLHAAHPMGTEDSGAVAPDRKATVTSRIVDQTTDGGRSISRRDGRPKSTGPHSGPPYQTPAGPSSGWSDGHLTPTVWCTATTASPHRRCLLSLRRIVIAAVLAVGLLPMPAAHAADQAGPSARSGSSIRTSVHYQDAQRHANERIRFKPGGRVTVPFKPRAW